MIIIIIIMIIVSHRTMWNAFTHHFMCQVSSFYVKGVVILCVRCRTIGWRKIAFVSSHFFHVEVYCPQTTNQLPSRIVRRHFIHIIASAYQHSCIQMYSVFVQDFPLTPSEFPNLSRFSPRKKSINTITVTIMQFFLPGEKREPFFGRNKSRPYQQRDNQISWKLLEQQCQNKAIRVST